MRIVFMGGAALFFFTLGLRMYLHRARVRARAMATLAWPRAPGRVTASYIGNATIPGAHEFGGIPGYKPHVLYSYEVAGAIYQGMRISFADSVDAKKKRVADLVAKYPVGAEVQVAYDPANPKASVLEQSLTGTSPVNFNVIVMFAAGVTAIVLLFRL
jgi:hypothetical protein